MSDLDLQHELNAVHKRLTAIEVAQQLMANQLKELAPDSAKRLASALENVAFTDKMLVDEHVRGHLKHLAHMLNSQFTPPISGIGEPLSTTLPSEGLKHDPSKE
ncbi:MULTISPECIES: hypothetical protein [Corallincola]|uniref:Uncharacterized protein n=2 Tax=Corallincola TaxID=1775176 RepID=A0ABY1WNS6_9GAMM|nr:MULTISPECIES: hypothetical protein [Corallincola]TAA45218.1 hypothetical protein EXY25_13535 [Corallincola spongiicola]TCI03505.1 hypothetical protein EZV61_08110 [Corallincola luteus]